MMRIVLPNAGVEVLFWPLFINLTHIEGCPVCACARKGSK
jgi:hypothetical protein